MRTTTPTYAAVQDLLKDAVQQLIEEALLPVKGLPLTDEVREVITKITQQRLRLIFWQLPLQLRFSTRQDVPPTIPEA